MPRKKREVENILKNKFAMEHKAGKRKKHFVLWYVIGNKKVIATHTSWGKFKEISEDLLSKMARNLGLTLAQFEDGLDCTLEKKEWDQLIQAYCIARSQNL